MDKVVKIALAGEGGQGVQSVAMILTEAAAMKGKEIQLWCETKGRGFHRLCADW